MNFQHALVAKVLIKGILEVICLLSLLDMIRKLVPMGHHTVREEVLPDLRLGSWWLHQVQVSCSGSCSYGWVSVTGEGEPSLGVNITFASQDLVCFNQISSKSSLF